MGALDEIGTTLPDGIDEESGNETKRNQTVKALSEDFRDSVKSKRTQVKPLDEIISDITVKEINDLFFEDTVPSVPGGHYYSIIEEFLSGPDFYKDKLQPIVDGYLSIVSDLQKRVQTLLLDGLTDEKDENNRTSTASYLDTRLTAICERTKLVIYVHKDVNKLQKQLSDMTDRVSENGELDLRIKQLETTLSDLNCAIYDGSTGKNGKETQGIKAVVENLSKKVNDIDASSDKIMPNIITLLGVFSSIIVVILSLITTSSTWLSNANEVSVLIAFVVPAGIVTLAICALTALIRSLVDSLSDREEKQPQTEKSWWFRLRSATKQIFQKWGLWLSIAMVASLIICGTMYFYHEENDDQTHYIVKCLPTSESTDYSNNREAPSTSEVSEPELFITQEIFLPTGEKYIEKVPCDESDIHEDGLIYYCLLHRRFE